jgi:hypothetical protein
MARGGFRTLVIAERELTRQEYEQWQERYQKASVSVAKPLSCVRFGRCINILQ